METTRTIVELDEIEDMAGDAKEECPGANALIVRELLAGAYGYLGDDADYAEANRLFTAAGL